MNTLSMSTSRAVRALSAFSTAFVGIGKPQVTLHELSPGLLTMRRAFANWKLADTVLWRWCDFHDHNSKEEEKKCWAWRDSLVKKGWQGE
jgi:hypothetical protein